MKVVILTGGFANYFLHMSDVTFDMAKNKMTVHENSAEPWKVTLVGKKTSELLSDFLIEPSPRFTQCPQRRVPGIYPDNAFCGIYRRPGEL